MGKYIYEDKEAWKAIVKKNYETVNASLPEDKKMSAEDIEKKAEERVADQALIDTFKHALKIEKMVNDRMAIFMKWKNEKLKADPNFDEKGLNGYGPFVYCKMDPSGTPEAEQKNFEYLDKLLDRDFAQKEVMKDYNRMLSQDPTKFTFSTPEEALKLYEDNMEMATICFSVDRMFSTVGKYELSSKFKEFYDTHKKPIETISACMSVYEQYKQPTRLVMPSVGPQELEDSVNHIIVNNMELEGKYEGMPLGSSSNGTVASYAQMMADFNIRPQEKYFMEETGKALPASIMSSYKCKINDVEAKIFEGVESKYFKDGRKVEFVEYTDEEKKTISYAMEHPFLSPEKMANSYEGMKALAKALNDTNHWYNWNNSTEFGNLVTALKNLSEDPRDYRSLGNLSKVFKKIETAAQAYFDKKNGTEMNKNGVKRFEICKSILDYTKKCISGEAFEIEVIQDEPLNRNPIDVTNELNDSKDEIEDILGEKSELDKTICFEKDSAEEQEFLNSMNN